MPATESTWRSMKLMHVVFGIASVAMLVTTVWMLADDHNRPWKNYQRKYRDVESWTAAARVNEQQTEDYEQTHKQLEAQMRAIEAAALSDEGRQWFNKFVEEARKKTEAEDEGEANADAQAADKIAADVEKLAGFTDAKQIRDLRMDLYNRMRDFIARVKFREDNLTTNVKFRRAALDKALATFSIAVGNNAPPDEIGRLQEEIDAVKHDVDQLSLLQQQVQAHRKELEAIFHEITADHEQAEKTLKEHQQKLTSLRKAFDQRKGNFGKTVLEMPVLDAFNSPLKIDPIWLPDLTLNNNFKEVARFDHCTTCHQAIEKTAPGSAVAPAYDRAHQVTISLPTPKDPPQPQKDSDGNELPVNTEQVYGFRLADRGALNRDDVTVLAVFPKTPAAQTGLMAGDVIERVDDAQILNLDRAEVSLLQNVNWGKPLSLTIRRGLPHPYSSHPRLDLF